uniref:Phorbol-ester/DAG-type domain-containing protein n=1 Tax=Arcella intermedia TaxID=1963864 RepID=A0A6B2LEX7_9EUKA
MTTFTHPVWCDLCDKFIWGLTEQGYKCKGCDMVSHKKCRTTSIQCGAAKKAKKERGGMGSGEVLLEAKQVEEAKKSGLYRVEVTGTVPSPHWYYHEGDLWWPYEDTLGERIEELYKKSLSKGESKAVLDDVTFKFDKMKSEKDGASKFKWICRGTWFYSDDQNILRPYSTDIGNKLETLFQQYSSKQQLDTATFEMLVDEKPVKMVVSVPDSNLEQFKEMRVGGGNEERVVFRGYKGKVLVKCNMELI